MDALLDHWRDIGTLVTPRLTQLEVKYLVQNRVTGEYITESAQFLYILGPRACLPIMEKKRVMGLYTNVSTIATSKFKISLSLHRFMADKNPYSSIQLSVFDWKRGQFRFPLMLTASAIIICSKCDRHYTIPARWLTYFYNGTCCGQCDAILTVSPLHLQNTGAELTGSRVLTPAIIG